MFSRCDRSFAAISFVAFVIFIAGVFAGLQQNVKTKMTTPVLTRHNESVTENTRLVAADFLIEPADSPQTGTVEEKRNVLREHLLLSIHRRANSGDYLFISPEWMLTVLDEATKEIRDLSAQLGDKYRAEREELPYRHPTTHLTCPYTGQMRPAPSR